MRDQLTIVQYEIISDTLPPMRIAQVADLHDRNPVEVLRALRYVQPDLIVSTGDLMERHEAGASEWTYEKMDAWQGIGVHHSRIHKAVKWVDKVFSPAWKKQGWSWRNGRGFIRHAAQIAPLYLSVGNHEWYFTDRDRETMASAGAHMLDNRSEMVQLPNGGSFRIGGLSTRYDMDWLKQFADAEEPKLLLCHHPDYYIRMIRGTSRDRFDLILSGHTHGGQWRILGQPVFSPGQGIFPKYAYGAYDEKMIVSSGVSNTAQIPRFGNHRELVVINIRKGNDGNDS